MEIDSYSIAGSLSTDYIKYYLERVLSYDMQAKLAKKTNTELVDLFVNEISHQDLMNFGLVTKDANKDELNVNTKSNVYDVDFFRSADVGPRRLDFVA